MILSCEYLNTVLATLIKTDKKQANALSIIFRSQR